MAQARVLIQTNEDLVVSAPAAAPQPARGAAVVAAPAAAAGGGLFRVCSPTKEQRLEMLRQSVAAEEEAGEDEQAHKAWSIYLRDYGGLPSEAKYVTTARERLRSE